jgi:hypothetical protein
MGINTKKQTIKQSVLYEELKELKDDVFYKISYQSILKELNISYEDYVSMLYKNYGIFQPPEFFDKDNLSLLIDILKFYQQEELLNIIKKWGMYFEPQELMEWLEHYISITLSILSNHEVKLDSLEISLAGCNNPYEAFDFYCNLNIDEDYIYKKTTELFLNKKNIKPNDFNFYLLTQYIENCYERKILSQDILYESFYKKLYDIGLKNNFIKNNHKINNNYNFKNEYFKTFGIEKLPATKEELKKIYFSLLKKYHPDKNPSGLENTKKIIEAYTKLIEYYE